jgi:peroxiredoxin
LQSRTAGIAASLAEITRLGTKLAAISLQTPDESLSTAEKNMLAFPVRSDAGSATAKSFGIAYDLAGIAADLHTLRPRVARQER